MELSHGLRAALAAADSDRLVFDLSGIEDRHDELVRQLPGVAVRFAVKACPADEVIAALAARGAGCDAASPNEIAQALRAGVPVERIHYGNTSKSDVNIAEAFRLGVRDFATDSLQDMAAIAEHAPGSRVFCRLATSGEGALWGLTGKFGCSPSDAMAVMAAARELGLTPAGLSVHVGSQQMRPEAWRTAFDDLAQVIEGLKEQRIRVSYVNLGGGLPALGYLDRRGVPLDPPLDKIFATIRDGMQHLSGLASGTLDFIAEPGRYLVADLGAIRAHVQRLSSRELVDGGERENWLYLSVGKYNGLYEMDELQYRLVFPRHESDAAAAGERLPAVVAGPTCDSDDAYAHEDNLVPVPASLESGEPVWILSCGAYATSYTTRGFNGIDPLPVHWVRGPRVRPIAEADWDAIAALEHDTYAACGLSEDRETLESRARISPATCFVVEVEGRVAGYVLSLPYPPGSHPDLSVRERGMAEHTVGDPAAEHANLHLHDLVVAADQRGRGYAKLLLRHLESAACAAMYERISLVSVEGSESFWAAAGFHAEPAAHPPAGYGDRAVYMSKSVEVDRLAPYPR
ncbi:GNAT family N-acetyltransferase [Actinospica sp. MGRD01-02]|uniref:ornithine decarboxylase n=1 Tax=Actinospica acidithermotolerans TaxID=2828514 RepID=A0A941IN29_9ACTN|nr:GNAT family N-acetyltransferase [Actinospica acidithermotolerans]MBR7829106.1 GNAT family N-acetyltransferase [Actinospica acidithermotolerans]